MFLLCLWAPLPSGAQSVASGSTIEEWPEDITRLFAEARLVAKSIFLTPEEYDMESGLSFHGWREAELKKAAIELGLYEAPPEEPYRPPHWLRSSHKEVLLTLGAGLLLIIIIVRVVDRHKKHIAHETIHIGGKPITLNKILVEISSEVGLPLKHQLKLSHPLFLSSQDVIKAAKLGLPYFPEKACYYASVMSFVGHSLLDMANETDSKSESAQLGMIAEVLLTRAEKMLKPPP